MVARAMKRALLSLFLIGTISVIVFGITQAFFSDTETSKDNVLGVANSFSEVFNLLFGSNSVD